MAASKQYDSDLEDNCTDTWIPPKDNPDCSLVHTHISEPFDSERNDSKENDNSDTWIPPKNELDDSLINKIASMQCDSDWCSNGDTHDLKENCKDSRLTTKNDLDDTCINIAASMQCDSDWCTLADTQDLKETCTDAQLSLKNDIVNTFNMTASIQCDSDWCINADSQNLKEKCTDVRLSPKRSTTSPDEQIKELRILFELVEDMLRSQDFDEDLQDELIKAFPNYRTILLTAKRDLLRNDCEIVVVGDTTAGKTTLINQLVGGNIFRTGMLQTTNKITRIRNSETMKIRCYSKDEILTQEKEVQDVKEIKSIMKRLTYFQMPSRYNPDKYFVDVYLPVPILKIKHSDEGKIGKELLTHDIHKGNVILVDTPPIGENDSLDNILLDYLPHAVSFVFVVNAFDTFGINEKRLLKVLKTIMNIREKMPCFDPSDVLFLTNQWDLIENYDSTSEEDDNNFWQSEDQYTRTWNFIQRTFEKVWCAFDVENVFRVSLKQVGKGIDTFFTVEYKRFKAKLKKTIEKNKKKRVKFYFRFLKDFVQNAQRSSHERLQTLKKSEEEIKETINQNISKMHYLETKRYEIRRQLDRTKTTIIMKLTTKLRHYIHSTRGKEDILNPPDTKGICEVSYVVLFQEVRLRLKKGVQRWCKGPVAKLIIDNADATLRAYIKDLSTELQNLAITMTESPLIVQYWQNGDTLSWEPLLFSLPQVISVALDSAFCSISFRGYLYFGSDPIREKANKIYDSYLSQISTSVFEKKLEKSVDLEYSEVIMSIIYEYLPDVLNSLFATNERLVETNKELKQKQESFVILGENIWKIQEATKDFEQKY